MSAFGGDALQRNAMLIKLSFILIDTHSDIFTRLQQQTRKEIKIELFTLFNSSVFNQKQNKYIESGVREELNLHPCFPSHTQKNMLSMQVDQNVWNSSTVLEPD